MLIIYLFYLKTKFKKNTDQPLTFDYFPKFSKTRNWIMVASVISNIVLHHSERNRKIMILKTVVTKVQKRKTKFNCNCCDIRATKYTLLTINDQIFENDLTLPTFGPF